MKSICGLAVIAAIATLVGVAYADKQLSLADLKQLVADKAYQEALQHLDDVPPTARSGDWVTIGGAAAAGYVEPLDASDGSVLGVIDAIDRQYPQLLKSPAYAKVRAARGPLGLAGCLERIGDSGDGQDACMQLGQRLVDGGGGGGGGDRALAIAVAKVGTEHGTPAAIVPMWRRLVGGSDTSACGEADLASAVLGGLDRAKDSALAGDARAVMATCWTQLEAVVVKAFGDATPHSDFRKNTCEQMKAKQKLSGLQAKQCG